MYQWFDCHIPGWRGFTGYFQADAENCTGFPPPLDKQIAFKSDVYLTFKSRQKEHCANKVVPVSQISLQSAFLILQGEQSAILNQTNMSVDSKMEKKRFLNHLLKA